MSTNFVNHCVIIGSGPAGYTAAIYAARSGLNPVLYTGLQPGGQLTTTSVVENFPGYKNGISGPEMMIDLQKQAERFGTKIFYKVINQIDFSFNSGEVHKIYLSNNETVLSKSIIIATGASPKYLGLKIEEKYLGKGISTCAICDGFFYKDQPVVVIGGGDTAIEEAVYLSKICTKVTLLVRKGFFKASKLMVNRLLSYQNIETLFHYELKDIEGDNLIEKVVIINNKTKKLKTIIANGVFIAIGHIPNTSNFNNIKKDKIGYLITDKDSTKTNIPGVFAAGDVEDKVYRQAITAAGRGCMAALDAERYLSLYY